MKTIFVVNGVVTGHGTVYSGSVAVSSADPTATAYVVANTSPVDVGWTCVVTAGQPVFTAPATPAYATLTPMQFYLAFKTSERMLLKQMATTGIPESGGTAAIPVDPIVAEFWETYQLAVQTNTPIDPNLTSIQEGLAYLTSPTAPTPAVIASARIPQILQGIAQ